LTRAALAVGGALVLGALSAATPARADFVRGSIKIDVRDASGKPREAEVTVTAAGAANAGAANGSANNAPKVTRVGDVYVAAGLLDGKYTVTVAGAEPQTVDVKGRMDRGIVFVVGGKKPQTFTLGARDVACDPLDGVVVEAVAFARGGGLGAGRIDVRKHDGGKPVCSAIVAGGAATVRLLPGDYIVSAHLVGGGKSEQRYVIRRDETPHPLALRAR
jgi:hypothetical protein